ncbi:MAG: ribosome maturation factor RimM [Flavobacteriales bacterium]
MDNLKVLGTITRSHGLKGFFKVNIHSAGLPPIEKEEPVFIQLQGGPVPFFVEECSAASHNLWIMKLEEIDTLEAADKYVGKEMLMEESSFVGVKTEATEELVGFRVEDSEKGQIGLVSGIMETAQHPVIEIEQDDNLILVPWVDAIVKEIDMDARLIKIEAPDGLIDLYVNG